ncbi:MAG TPA: acyl-CoA dehydrogenase family protein, partial [Lacipirellulaceae bacterium]|nr:acyl-CoA dehydrogenase family protein [Lacipirellulaceae bacterium]
MAPSIITSPDDPALAELCRELAGRAAALDASGAWPADQLRLCGEYGVFQWFAGQQWGGQAWSAEDVLRGYLALSAACLTTTFVITQREGACRRIEASENRALKERLLPALTRGERHATVGISHLTTSRRHLAAPPLVARRARGGFRLDGYSPWVTGAPHADYVVLGATLAVGEVPAAEQLLAVVPRDARGARAGETARLIALSASHTGEFRCEDVAVADDGVIAGPVENVMATGAGAGTGGLQTSTLALGLARSALDYLVAETARRPELEAPYAALEADYARQTEALLAAARG